MPPTLDYDQLVKLYTVLPPGTLLRLREAFAAEVPTSDEHREFVQVRLKALDAVIARRK